MLRQLARRHLRSSAFAVAAKRHFSAEQPAATKSGGGGVVGILLVAAAGGAAFYAYDQGLFASGGIQPPTLGLKGTSIKAGDYGAVKKAIEDSLEVADYDDGSYGPILVRLAWHSSGSYSKYDNKGGSNGATMRFEPEKSYGGNAGLGVARDFLEPIKQQFPWISYADLYTLAGKVAIETMGGPEIAWQEGRTDQTDGKLAEPDGRLPDGAKGAQHLRDVFYRMGFDDREIVALSGAHALGRCHADRSGFDGPWTFSPTTFSNSYFILLRDEKWLKNKLPTGILQYKDKWSGSLMMLPTDMALIWDKKFKPIVLEYAENEETFFKDFAKAFAKLLELGVPRTLTGSPNPKPAPA